MMIDSMAKKWRILEGGTPANNKYTGSFSFTAKGQLLVGEWEIQEGTKRMEKYNGIGMVFKDYLFFSRSKSHSQTAASTPPTPEDIDCNIGKYSVIGETGAISAMWAEPFIYYNAGSGIAVGGEIGAIEGQYQVSYFNPGEKDPTTLDLHISTRNKEQALHHLEWIKKGELILKGTGILTEGDLPMAYNTLNKESQLVVYKYDGGSMPQILKGQWSSTLSSVMGTELLTQ